MKRSNLLPGLLVLITCWVGLQVWTLGSMSSAIAQSKTPSKSSKTTTKKKVGTSVLDVRANEIQDSFVKDAEALAGEYYDAGDLEKARLLLKAVQTLKPDHPNLESKLKLLDEEQLVANQTEIEVNVRNGWEPSGLMVTAGKPIRIKAEGTYKFDLSSQLTPLGFSVGKTANDISADIPLGTLMGIVLTEKSPAGTNRDDDKKKDRPFTIGMGCEFTSQKDGMLFLRVNAPAEAKNTGKIKVLISGGVKSLK